MINHSGIGTAQVFHCSRSLSLSLLFTESINVVREYPPLLSAFVIKFTDVSVLVRTSMIGHGVNLILQQPSISEPLLAALKAIFPKFYLLTCAIHACYWWATAITWTPYIVFACLILFLLAFSSVCLSVC